MEKNNLYREKNLKKAMGAEDLDRGLKVTSYSSWIVVIAGFLVIAAIIFFAVIEDIRDVVNAAGNCYEGTLTVYFRKEDIPALKEGMDVIVDGKTYKLDKIEQYIYTSDDLSKDVVYYSPKGYWFQSALVRCDLDNGTYQVTVPLGDIKPFSFMTGGQVADQ